MAPEGREDASVADDASERDLARRQREVSGELVLSSLRAQEEADAAAAREEELRAMGELRERLVGILGHDLRTPLNAIVIAAGVLVARGNLTESDARVAALVLRCGQRMDRMISQLLDFTRVRMGGGLHLEWRPSDLGEMCREIAQEFDLPAAARVRYDAEGDVSGSFDVDRLSEALANIVGNAVEHATAGTQVVLHTCGRGDTAVVEVTNEGAPIPADVLPHIFEPFRRALQQEHSKTGNLGLGLHIAYEVVRAHGGAIEARCANGKTTFTLRVPRWPAPAPSQRSGST